MDIQNRGFIVNLPVQEARKLYLEPAVYGPNPLKNELGLIDWTMGKDKVTMSHLRSNRFNLQPKAPCDKWNPTVRYGMRPDSLNVTDYELNGEQCPDEFEDGCLRLMQGTLGQGTVPEFGGTPEANALWNAMITSLSNSLAGDINPLFYFSDPDIRAKAEAGVYGEDPFPLDPVQRERMFTMLEQQVGIWAEIEARTQETNTAARINYVDTNDGTEGGNATRPENIVDFMTDLVRNSTHILRQWYSPTAAFAQPVILLQTGLYMAYKSYLRSGGTEAAYQFSLNGEVQRDSLMFDGYPVIHMPEWEQHDMDMGRVSASGTNRGYSSKQRALFTVLGNLSGIANLSSIASQPGSGLLIQQSPLLKDKGLYYMYANYGLGAGIAQPELMTAAYNSSTTFA